MLWVAGGIEHGPLLRSTVIPGHRLDPPILCQVRVGLLRTISRFKSQKQSGIGMISTSLAHLFTRFLNTNTDVSLFD